MDMDSAPFSPTDAAGDGEALRVVDWAGLVAKLCAERDLRRELTTRGGAAEASGASFAAGAAGAFARGDADQPAINPEDLADRKAPGGITPPLEAPHASAGSDARGQE